ncbi:hypothetical protein VOLCADRAFT_91243 [Volvox carteri f. nagariensis]|uniref:N-acetyltransferase domain-containing protein n=1 Tax=Volvox carteri f. nagariensis TaxID=3068 RepID=D8TWJ6_VOLCA|nr:uncharacterized protein VOLCADRAFT_91243 [Volvox carteri f. nagariensis]EFJ48057.1 hypothetical protein VOLCADRAFT_91243 [Volvox carteri f. nagariensis]|eukprot:XP_002950742.1 hypothetical protein VOLCADRAFT_91243 [Volvox carteri f. nagariensis]
MFRGIWRAPGVAYSYRASNSSRHCAHRGHLRTNFQRSDPYALAACRATPDDAGAIPVTQPRRLRIQLARRDEDFDAVARLWAEALLLPGLTELPPPAGDRAEGELRQMTEHVARRLRQAYEKKLRAASESRSLRREAEVLTQTINTTNTIGRSSGSGSKGGNERRGNGTGGGGGGGGGGGIVLNPLERLLMIRRLQAVRSKAGSRSGFGPGSGGASFSAKHPQVVGRGHADDVIGIRQRPPEYSGPGKVPTVAATGTAAAAASGKDLTGHEDRGGGGGSSRHGTTGGGDVAVGYVLVSISQPLALLPPPLPSMAPHQLHADALAVRESHRRQGAGSALLAAAERLAKRWGGNSLWLHVDSSNDAAVQLYSDRGYGIVRIQGPNLMSGLTAGACRRPPWGGSTAVRWPPPAPPTPQQQQQLRNQGEGREGQKLHSQSPQGQNPGTTVVDMSVRVQQQRQQQLMLLRNHSSNETKDNGAPKQFLQSPAQVPQPFLRNDDPVATPMMVTAEALLEQWRVRRRRSRTFVMQKRLPVLPACTERHVHTIQRLSVRFENDRDDEEEEEEEVGGGKGAQEGGIEGGKGRLQTVQAMSASEYTTKLREGNGRTLAGQVGAGLLDSGGEADSPSSSISDPVPGPLRDMPDPLEAGGVSSNGGRKMGADLEPQSGRERGSGSGGGSGSGSGSGGDSGSASARRVYKWRMHG